MHPTSLRPLPSSEHGAPADPAFFRSLIENSRDAVVVADSDGIIRYQSPAVNAQLAYADGECLGRHVLDFVHPDDRALVERTLNAATASPGSREWMELRLRVKDGSWRWVEVRATNLLADPAVRGMVLNTLVIQERKALELRNSAAKLDPHFLFNVLHAVAGMVREKNVDASVEALARLRELTISHLGTAKGDLTTLDEEWSWTRDYLSLQQLRFGPALAVTLGPLPPQVKRDRVPYRVIQPLVENALEHGLRRRTSLGSVRVHAELARDCLFVRVVEEGGEKAALDGRQGLGVGLEITRQRLHHHFGDAADLTLSVGALSSEAVLKLPRPAPAGSVVREHRTLPLGG